MKALQKHPFHALHYIGHGVYDRELERGVLLFEDESGWARPISGDKLGMILHTCMWWKRRRSCRTVRPNMIHENLSAAIEDLSARIIAIRDSL